MTAEQLFTLTPVTHAMAIAWGKYNIKPQIPTAYEILERIYYAKKTRSFH